MWINMNKLILDDSFGGFAPLVFLPNEATEHIMDIQIQNGM